jgi:hypothetical protein
MEAGPTRAYPKPLMWIFLNSAARLLIPTKDSPKLLRLDVDTNSTIATTIICVDAVPRTLLHHFTQRLAPMSRLHFQPELG